MQIRFSHQPQATKLTHLSHMFLNSCAILPSNWDHTSWHTSNWRRNLGIVWVGKPIKYIFEGRRHFSEEFRDYEDQSIKFLHFLPDILNTWGKFVWKHIYIDQRNLFDIQKFYFKHIFEKTTFFTNISHLWFLLKSSRNGSYS